MAASMGAAGVGVLIEYFRAPGKEAALRLLDHGDGVPGSPATVGEGVDALDAKGVDPAVVLGKPLGLIRSVPWSVDLVETVAVWPPEDTKPRSREEMGRLPAESPWNTGPWLQELGEGLRDAFAGADDDALPAIAGEWSRIEELDGVDTTIALGFVEEFVALSRRARRAGDRLYCWICL
jgi:hypothetical protein